MKKLLFVAVLAALTWVVYKTVTADVVVRRINAVSPAFSLKNLPMDNTLAKAETCGGTLAKGAEAILPLRIGQQQYLYTGVEDGRVFRISLSATQQCGAAEEIANTGGRPLGMELMPNGDVIIADAFKGLMRLKQDGSLSVIVDSFQGQKMRFVDDVVADSAGNLYFSDASRYDYDHYKHDSIEGRPYGRVFKWRAVDGELELLLSGLYFANGVTLAPDESFLLVNESANHSIRRYWLKGLKAGKHDVFAEALPGFPDNIRPAQGGGYWVGLPYKRDAISDFIQQSKWARAFMTALPDAVMNLTPKVGLLLKLDAKGEFNRLLQDVDTKAMYQVTHGVEVADYLYTGGLNHHSLMRVRLTQ